MKILKKNLNIMIAFFIGVLLASSITVYAYSYYANQVEYKRNGTNIENVEGALNDLYEKQEKASMIINLECDSNGATNGTSGFNFKEIDQYKFFKVLEFKSDDNVGASQITGWSRDQSNTINLNINQEYKIKNEDDGYNFISIILISRSKSNVWSRSTARVVLYN